MFICFVVVNLLGVMVVVDNLIEVDVFGIVFIIVIFWLNKFIIVVVDIFVKIERMRWCG